MFATPLFAMIAPPSTAVPPKNTKSAPPINADKSGIKPVFKISNWPSEIAVKALIPPIAWVLTFTPSSSKYPNSSAKILNDLRVLYDELLKVGLENKVVFDFSISQYANYYTGITFQVFAGGIGRAVISGGRCDQLLKSFGKDLPAIGFGLDVDAILEYIISNKLIEINNLRYVSFSDESSHEFALKNNEELRNKGIIVEVSMLDSLDDTIKYAKNSGALVVLNYKNNKLEEIKVGE